MPEARVLEQDGRRVIIAWCVAIATLILVSGYIFASVLDNDWITYDNNKMIHRHPGVGQGAIKDIFGTEGYRDLAVLYQPLVVLSLAIDYQLFGLEDKPGWAWHSFLLHEAVMILLVALLFRLTGSLAAGLAGGLLVAAHPLVVEPVTWIICRTFLLAGQIVCYGVSMLAKPLLGIVLLPLLLDAWHRRRITPAVLLEKLPLLLIAIAFTLVNVNTVASGQGPLRPLVHDWQTLIARVFGGTVWTLANTLVPAKLTIFYRYNGAWQVIGWRGFAVAGFLLAWVALVILAWRRLGRELLLCGLGWLVLFVPQLGVLRYRNTLTADRYSYVPLWFVGLAAAVLLAYLLRPDKAASRRRRPAGYVAVAVTVALAICAASVSNRYTQKWEDEVTLWKDVVSQTPGAIPYGEMANLLIGRARQAKSPEQKKRQYQLAADVLAEAVTIDAVKADANYFQLWARLGALYRALGRPDQAIDALKNAIGECNRMFRGMDPADRERLLSTCRTDLGQAYLQKHRYTEAIECFRRAANADPQNYKALTEWGRALYRQGEIHKAWDKCRAALAIQPKYGRALSLRNRLDSLRGYRPGTLPARR